MFTRFKMPELDQPLRGRAPVCRIGGAPWKGPAMSPAGLPRASGASPAPPRRGRLAGSPRPRRRTPVRSASKPGARVSIWYLAEKRPDAASAGRGSS